jgi:MSHA biogenesis protein MshM
VYHAFFGLQRAPFKITPDPDFFFEGGSRGAVLGALLYAVAQGEGIIKVTGEVGSGKTMLCRVLQQRLGTSVDMIYLANPNVAPDEILHAIALEMQLKLPRDATRVEAIHALQKTLVARHAKGRQVVLFVEESQGMPIGTLEEIRLLSNLETEQHKLLQIILFGQPELDQNLQKPDIRQLRERITNSFDLAPFDREEIAEYLRFRLRAAGYRGPDLFPPAAVELIAQASKGLTRRINIIADKALLAAYTENTHTVTPKHIRTAIADSEFSRAAVRGKMRRESTKLATQLGIIAVGGGLAAWLLYDHFAGRPDTPVAATRPHATPATTQPAPAAAAPPPTAVATPITGPDAAPTLRLSEDIDARPVSAAAAPSQPVTRPPAPQTTTPSPAAVAATRAATVAAKAAPPAPAPATPVARAEPPLPAPVRTPPQARPVAAPPSVGAADPSADPDPEADALLERRARAMGPWLAAQPAVGYTVQMVGAADAWYLKHYLKSIPKSVDSESLLVYRKLADARPSLTVIRGYYATPAEAAEAIEALPPELQRFQPYLRSLRAVRAEFEAVNRAGAGLATAQTNAQGSAADR